MATPKQIKQFDEALRKAIDGTLDFEDETVRKVIRELRSLRVRIGAAIINSEGFEQIHFQAIKNDIEKLFTQWARNVDGVIDEATEEAFSLGQTIIDKPFEAAGGAIEVSALPQISTQALAAQIERNTTFITNLSRNAADRINTTILTGISGELSPNQVMRQIGTVLTDGSVYRSIAVRAEMITRTEINTALNKATLLRAEQADRQIGGLRKYWIHTADKRTRAEHVAVGNRTNPNRGGTPIPIKQKFRVGGKRGKGPQDPALGAEQVIGCRCRLGFKMLRSAQVEESFIN